MSYKILIVDDDESIVDFLSIFLKKDGYEVSVSYNGESALNKIKNQQFDLILMDIMMPKMDGITAIKNIRKISTIPIIFLTAKDNQQDKIKGFISGCDDYITKPFDLVELSLRISAILRRVNVQESDENKEIIRVKDLNLNLKEHTLYRDKKEIQLTPKEFDILYLLSKNKGRVFSSNEIYERIWEEKFLESDNSVLTHIRNLREKLNDSVKNSKYIKTVWGVGYKIEKEI
ncbi:response regulator transcription factor [Haloimpatiens sp. FM7330]|uniref:response regulator transcription factor n=1 Tax=Haloimpatiens sp. FM7330 TaxID=3298610 RepID=UPI00362CAB35